MFKLVIQDDEGKQTVVPLIRDEITIGRKEGNTIRLTERNVSRRHARILRNNGEVHIEDLGSYNGIRVNNARIAERVSLRVSDQVQIGDYKLYLKAEGHEQTDDSRTIPLERVDSQILTEAMVAVTPVAPAPHPIHQAPTAQLAGNANRTMVAIADTDPAVHTVGSATQEAVTALTAQGGYGKLVVLSSNFAGKEFELSRSQMIIGRTDENDIVINHRSISRNHAKLVREPETGRYTISDLQSSNGVRVNGQDYGKVELRRGDVVDLGHVRLRFVEAGEDFVFARDAVITDVPETGGRRGIVVAILAAIVVVVAGIVIYTMRDKPKNPVIEPRAGTNSELPLDAGDGALVTSDRPDAGIVHDAAAATNVAAKLDEEQTQKIGKCTELITRRDWQALTNCAGELEVLGVKDRAQEFKAKALKEQDSELKAKDVQQALRERNLKGAETLLAKIGDGSVYYKSLLDEFNKAEAPAIEEAKRKAQGYAAAHDCAGLKQYKVQVAANTQRVVAAVQAVKCEKAPVEPIVRPPNGNGSGSATPPVNPTQPAKGPSCDTMDVDEAMRQASNQYSNGFAGAALSVMSKALACKQDIKMYRLAATYACAAHDLASAKTYFTKVPAQFQSPIEQKCQQEGLNLRGP